jgi:hypothetical protein
MNGVPARGEMRRSLHCALRAPVEMTEFWWRFVPGRRLRYCAACLLVKLSMMVVPPRSGVVLDLTRMVP